MEQFQIPAHRTLNGKRQGSDLRVRIPDFPRSAAPQTTSLSLGPVRFDPKDLPMLGERRALPSDSFVRENAMILVCGAFAVVLVALALLGPYLPGVQP